MTLGSMCGTTAHGKTDGDATPARHAALIRLTIEGTIRPKMSGSAG